MGYIDDIQAMDLADDVKQQLIDAHRKELDPLRDSNQILAAQARKEAVEREVEGLKALGFAEAPGLLKYTRRVFLSADAEQPGAVLLSDTELNLSGDLATGASGREEISVAGALRKFIELLPRNAEGKLNLSDMAIVTDDHGRPAKGEDDPEAQAEERKARTARLAGRVIDREAVRSKRYGTSTIVGGGD